MNPNVFNRQQHLYKNPAFSELVKDAVRFFNGTPVHTMPPPEIFLGTGVYALYYTGHNPLYQKYAAQNRLAYNQPIYVGKAVPTGWRQARSTANALNQSRELHNRLREHSRSIMVARGLFVEEFMCRFVIFEAETSDMIGTIEAALIKLSQPLWNVAVDGFGNHDPGRGRYAQAKSDWDVIHPGRVWADRCTGRSKDESIILTKIAHYFNQSEGKS
jgi:hypothetical protein